MLIGINNFQSNITYLNEQNKVTYPDPIATLSWRIQSTFFKETQYASRKYREINLIL
jgi:hypothetical protein